MPKSTKKTLKGSSIDDRLLVAYSDMRDFKKPKEYNFHKFVECDFVYLINDWLTLDRRGSMVMLVKDEKILDIFGPVTKVKINSELVHGETVGLEFVSKNKFKIRHVYFKLAVSLLKDTLLIQPRNIFKEEFIYDK